MEKCTDKRIGESLALFEFGALEGHERTGFLDHLIECEFCYDQIYSMEPFSTAFRNHRTAARQSGTDQSSESIEGLVESRRSWWNWRPTTVMAASLVLAIAIGSGFLLGRIYQSGVVKPPDTDEHPPVVAGGTVSLWKDLEIPKAAYRPPIERPVLRSPGQAFNRALEAYQRNDFAGAVERLETLSELEPETAVEVKFYLGVSLLLTGRNQDAISPLRQAVQFSVGPRQESSHYYLALALLKCNYEDQALDELDATIKMNGQHRSDAEELKRKIFALTR